MANTRPAFFLTWISGRLSRPDPSRRPNRTKRHLCSARALSQCLRRRTLAKGEICDHTRFFCDHEFEKLAGFLRKLPRCGHISISRSPVPNLSSLRSRSRRWKTVNSIRRWNLASLRWLGHRSVEAGLQILNPAGNEQSRLRWIKSPSSSR